MGRVDEWERMRNGLARVTDVEKRVEELERKLGSDYPPDVCKFCGKREVRMTGSRAMDYKSGVVRQEWTCKACAREEVRTAKPG